METMRKRSKWIQRLLVVFLAGLLMSSCASLKSGYHAYLMKGSIVEASDGEIYLCVGTKDGAIVGQELDVYRIKSKWQPKGPPDFRRELTGKVKITEILNEHFAKAMVISGKADINSIVELKNQ